MTQELEKILREVDTKFVPAVQEKFSQGLKSILLYGSAARGTFVEKQSDVNLLVLIDQPDPRAIMRFGSENSKLLKRNRISLHILTVREFLNSADVFPMEYLDIMDAHRLLWGEDPTEQLHITQSHLRHQVEERLRGAIHSMRQALIGAGTSRKTLERVLRNSFGAQLALYRGLLRLKNADRIPNGEGAIIEKLHEVFDISIEPLRNLLDLRNGEKRDVEKISVDLITFLTSLVAQVDAMETGK
jgi:predicted nucleotidyltransferase